MKIKIHSLYYALLGTILTACSGGSISQNTPSPPHVLVCKWSEVGNAESFFGNLVNSQGYASSNSPMLLSSDNKTLYVGGIVNTTSPGLGSPPPYVVAKISVPDGTAWQPVANSQDVIGQMSTLSALGMSGDGHIVYAAGSKNTTGEQRPIVYASADNSDWSEIGNMFSDLSLNNPTNYNVTSLVVNGSILFSSVVMNTNNSFVAQSTNGGVWSYVSNSNIFFQNKQIYSMAYYNGVLYVAGSSSGGSPMIAKFEANTWTDISPNSPLSGAIYSLSVSGSNIYAAGVDMTAISKGLIYSSPISSIAWNNLSGNSFLSGSVFSIATAANQIYASGSFESSLKVSSTSSINWTTISDESALLDNIVANMLVSSENEIYFDGEFTSKVVKYLCQ